VDGDAGVVLTLSEPERQRGAAVCLSLALGL